MNLTNVEQVILARFKERTLRAGGVNPGYGMRFKALQYHLPSEAEVRTVLNAMVEKGLLKANAAGTWYFLTESGAEQVKAA
jgi:hypothetical protein